MAELSMARLVRVMHGDTEWTVETAADGVVTVGGQRFTVTPVGSSHYRVTAPDGGSWLVAVAGTPPATWVTSRGRTAQLTVDMGPARPRSARPAGGDLSAPMPATVIKVAVAVGDRVAAGSPIVVLEAMKMEFTVRAPRDGVVTAIACRAGDLVAPGRPLVEMA
jgi:biotin carboxyl carrier protein